MKKKGLHPVAGWFLVFLLVPVLAVLLSTCAEQPLDPPALQYVVDTIHSPTNAGEVTAASFDVDGNSTLENQLGSILLNFLGMGVVIQPALNASLSDGSMIQLLNIQAASVDDNTDVPTWLCTGEDADNPPNPVDNFSGSETFDVEPTSVGAVPLSGAISAGELTAGPGSIPLLFTAASGSAPVTLHLIGGRVRGQVTELGMSAGVVGGGIPAAEVSSLLIPAIHQAIAAIVEQDCSGGSCNVGSTGEALVAQYDDNSDNSVSLAEFQADPGVQTMFDSDLDLLDGSGQFAPNMDGTDDSLSCGIGFTAVRANFNLP